jgi:16S rRNA (guanine(966)-N(2))-methyltransferase RsmD
LFNWLQMHLRGAECVDLFAGSGVLGLEAASRGAARVTLIEKSKPAAEGIGESVSRLNAAGVEVVQGDAMDWLAGCEPQSLDIVFIDPPFGAGLETRALEMLVVRDCVRQGGFVYLETALDSPALAPGPGWEISREQVMGDVRMRVLKKI